MLCRATNVAAAICQVLSPVFSQLGTGRELLRKAGARLEHSSRTLRRTTNGLDRPTPTPRMPRPQQRLRPGTANNARRDYVRITPVLPTRELAAPCYQHVNSCTTASMPWLRSANCSRHQQLGRSAGPERRHARRLWPAAHDVARCERRGRSRRAARVAVALCVVALAVVAVSLFVAGVRQERSDHRSSPARNAGRGHGDAMLRVCWGAAAAMPSDTAASGPSSSTESAITTRFPGTHSWAPGTTVRLVTVESDPGLLSQPSTKWRASTRRGGCSFSRPCSSSC